MIKKIVITITEENGICQRSIHVMGVGSRAETAGHIAGAMNDVINSGLVKGCAKHSKNSGVIGNKHTTRKAQKPGKRSK